MLHAFRARCRLAGLFVRCQLMVAAADAVCLWYVQWMGWVAAKEEKERLAAEVARIHNLMLLATQRLTLINKGWQDTVILDGLGRWAERAEGFHETQRQLQAAREKQRQEEQDRVW